MNKVIYLDNAATTPVDRRVLEKMLPFFSEKFANPATKWTSSLSKEVDDYIEEARENIANLLNADVEEIYFTSGGTESDNAAIKGIAWANRDKGSEIISTHIEHEAVLRPLETLARQGFTIKFVPVDSKGFVYPDEVKKLITKHTILISIMHANNEIGSIEPIEEIGKIARENGIYFHTDAVQTVGHVPVDVKAMNIDLLSLSAHKFYGPKGVGALFVRRNTNIAPFMEGGGQERGLRSGTLNSTGIVGLGEAAKIAKAEMAFNEERIRKIRDTLFENIQREIPEVYLNGAEGEKRLSGNLNFVIKGIRSEPLLTTMNERGIVIGGGSACSAGSKEPSHVLRAIAVPDDDLFSGIRMTIGKFNSEDEVVPIVINLKDAVKKLRDLSPFWMKGD